MKTVSELDTRELLALAISSEEEDSRVYLDFSEGLRSNYPDSAKIFSDMAREENEHRRRLISLFVERFGDHIPMNPAPGHPRWIRRPPHWQVRALGIDAVRAHARQMEEESAKFYLMAAAQTSDAAARKLLGDLAETEMFHENKAAEIEARHLTGEAREREDGDARRRFVLEIVQPGLVGLMDGSVSALAPVFAAAFATHNSWNALLGRDCGLARGGHLDGLRRGARR